MTINSLLIGEEAFYLNLFNQLPCWGVNSRGRELGAGYWALRPGYWVLNWQWIAPQMGGWGVNSAGCGLINISVPLKITHPCPRLRSDYPSPEGN